MLGIVRTCAVDILEDFCVNTALYQEITDFVGIQCCYEDRCLTGGTTDEKTTTTSRPMTFPIESTTIGGVTSGETLTEKADMTTKSNGVRSTSIAWTYSMICFVMSLICFMSS